jgi:predicted HTH domain antitoxin
MSFSIPDEILKEAGLSEREAVVEFICRLFEAGRLALPAAARLSGLDRPEFEAELIKRHIPPYTPTVADLHQDLATIEHLEGTRPGSGG